MEIVHLSRFCDGLHRLCSELLLLDGTYTVVEGAAGDIEGNVSLVVEVVPHVSYRKAPSKMQFDGDTYDEDGLIQYLEWDLEGDCIHVADSYYSRTQNSVDKLCCMG